MLSVEDAQSAVLAGCAPLEAVTLPLLEARGMALSAPLVALNATPPFDNSAMDGYAVVAEDTLGASSDAPALLRVLGDLPAGQASSFTVRPGEAVRIMTGAPVPAGANAVVMVEETRAEGDTVLVNSPARPGQHIRRAGEDVAAGQEILSPGRALDAAALALLAAVGVGEVAVTRRPRVAVVTTGDELVEPGAPLSPGHIRNSNRYGVAAQVEEAGCELHALLHAPDTPEALRDILMAASNGADALVTTGGVSVGDYDYMKEILGELGQVAFWRVAVKPGKPFAYGTVQGVPLFGLPGNPVSAMLTFELFARPALRHMAGFSQVFREESGAVLLVDLPHRPGRAEYARARLEWNEDRWTACPVLAQGSHQLSGLVEANGFIIIPAESKGLTAGERARVIRF